MTDLALIPIDAVSEPAAPVRGWAEPPITLLPRTPLPETEEVDWDQWDSAVRWHDSKHSPL